MKAKLTKRSVESIAPAQIVTIVWDTELKGFGLKVTPTGRRSYFLYYRTQSGEQRRPTIGPHGAITPDEARQIARKWLVDVANGRDVSAQRKADRAAETVSDLTTRYLSEYANQHKKPTSVSADRGIIANHIIPQLGRQKIKSITRADIERCMIAIREGRTARELEPQRRRGRRIIRGGAVIANRAVALLSKMFSCAEAWGLIQSNPTQGVRKFRERRKDRFLDLDEIRRLIGSLDVADANGTETAYATGAIRLLLWTGMRSSEVRQLRWHEVDLDTECLRLTDTKTGARIIPLSSHTLEIIKSLPRGTNDDIVFQSSQKGSPLALTRPWYRVRAGAGIDSSATIHTLRHTFASWPVMGGQSLAQVGAVLGHKFAQTTLRYADHRLDALRSYSQQTGDIFMQTKTKRQHSLANKRAQA
jgi:integrase